MRHTLLASAASIILLAFPVLPLSAPDDECNHAGCECAIDAPTIEFVDPPPDGFGSATAGFNAAEPAKGGCCFQTFPDPDDNCTKKPCKYRVVISGTSSGGSVDWNLRGEGSQATTHTGPTFDFGSLSTQSISCGSDANYQLKVGGKVAASIEVKCNDCSGTPPIGGGV